MAAILDLGSKRGQIIKNNSSNEFLGPRNPRKHILIGKVAQIVGNVLFNVAAGGHFDFLPLKKLAHTFARVTLANFSN